MGETTFDGSAREPGCLVVEQQVELAIPWAEVRPQSKTFSEQGQRL
jgi:hypothetical protein